MKRTVLCHFYNEEYLLPWWLEHHKQIFDHGIMIDYHSTDRSREIIKEICPSWDIVTSRNPNFQADNIDYEVMDIERNIEGWRICINVTEFLIGNYSMLNDNPNQQLLIPSVFFVDCDRENDVTHDVALWEQKHHGFSYDQYFMERRARSLHNVPVQYPVPGRHYGNCNTDELVIFYYGWAPFNQPTLARKLQIQTQIPLVDRQRNWGFHHITNTETLTYRLEHEFIPRSKDLSGIVQKYKQYHETYRNKSLLQ